MKNRASVAFLLKVSLVCSCLTYLPNRVIASSTTEFTSLEIIETSSTTTQSPASTSVEEVSCCAALLLSIAMERSVIGVLVFVVFRSLAVGSCVRLRMKTLSK